MRNRLRILNKSLYCSDCQKELTTEKEGFNFFLTIWCNYCGKPALNTCLFWGHNTEILCIDCFQIKQTKENKSWILQNLERRILGYTWINKPN